MIIYTNLIPSKFNGMTAWPFIFIRKSSRYDKGLLVHEMVHYNEQRKAYVIPWLLKYIFSKKFRLEAEVRAYKVQIYQKGISLHSAARMLMNYRVDVTFDDAVAMLVSNQ